MNRAKIEDVLLAMGVPAGILGFNYIADAIEIFDERGTDISITKELYPTIAKKNETTPSRVERAIRHAFKTTRSRDMRPDAIKHYIGIDNCTNTSSLKMLYMKIKQEHGETEQEEQIKETIEQENKIEITSLEIREIIRQELRMFLNEIQNVQRS